MIPIYQILVEKKETIEKHKVYAIVILPTRELALQVYNVAQVFAKHTLISTKLVVGGEAGKCNSKKKKKHEIQQTFERTID